LEIQHHAMRVTNFTWLLGSFEISAAKERAARAARSARRTRFLSRQITAAPAAARSDGLKHGIGHAVAGIG
jgi:hypothetical protein